MLWTAVLPSYSISEKKRENFFFHSKAVTQNAFPCSKCYSMQTLSKYLQTNILQLNICRRVCLLKVFLECQFALCKQKFHYNWNIWPFCPVNMNQISPKSRGRFCALSIWTLIEFVEIHLGLIGIEIYQSCSKMHISPEQ